MRIRTRLSCSLIASAALISQVIAMDGISVFAVIHFIPCLEQKWGGMRFGGNLVRADIANNTVTSRDTIYHGNAQFPAINMQGTKVAFYRWGHTVTRVGQNLTCSETDQPNYIAVMNIDGTGLRNLVQVDVGTTGNFNGTDQEHTPIDWPCGDWVYYEKPFKTAEIWRVNINDPSRNEKVMGFRPETCSDANIRFWNLSMDGKYCGVQLRKQGTSCGTNSCYSFPDLSQQIGAPGCNMAISCGGNILTHYLYAPHSVIHFAKLNHAANTKTYYPAIPGYDAPQYAHHHIGHEEQWMGESIHGPDAGAGADLIQWSVNSEKWVIRYIGWCGQALPLTNGTNQIAVNWVDLQAINLSRTNQPLWCGGQSPIWWGATENGSPPASQFDQLYSDMAYTGDLWINHGPGNELKWEDENGGMHAVEPIDPLNPSVAPTPHRAHDSTPASITVSRGSLQLALQEQSLVRVFDAQGALVLSLLASANTTIAADRLGRGFLSVQVSGSGTVERAKVVVME